MEAPRALPPTLMCSPGLKTGSRSIKSCSWTTRKGTSWSATDSLKSTRPCWSRNASNFASRNAHLDPRNWTWWSRRAFATTTPRRCRISPSSILIAATFPGRLQRTTYATLRTRIRSRIPTTETSKPRRLMPGSRGLAISLLGKSRCCLACAGTVTR